LYPIPDQAPYGIALAFITSYTFCECSCRYCGWSVRFRSHHVLYLLFAKSIYRLLIWCMWAGKCSLYSDWLQAARSGERRPVWTRFSSLVQIGSGVHPTYCKMDTGSFAGGKEWPWRDVDPSLPYSAVVKKE